MYNRITFVIWRIILNTKILIFIFFTFIAMSGCSSNTDNSNQASVDNTQEEDSNLIKETELNEGQWINTKGEFKNNPEMVNTSPIDYNSNNQYLINKTSYISYFKGEEFIKTILYDYENEFPLAIENMGEADNIIVSFNVENNDSIQLTVE